jgi:hypothetical protein
MGVDAGNNTMSEPIETHTVEHRQGHHSPGHPARTNMRRGAS